MTEKEITLINELGMHARAAALFTRTATAYSSEITLLKGGAAINAKSIMGILMLAIPKGGRFIIRAAGSDESEAVNALSKLAESRFGEDK